MNTCMILVKSHIPVCKTCKFCCLTSHSCSFTHNKIFFIMISEIHDTDQFRRTGELQNWKKFHFKNKLDNCVLVIYDPFRLARVTSSSSF